MTWLAPQRDSIARGKAELDRVLIERIKEHRARHEADPGWLDRAFPTLPFNPRFPAMFTYVNLVRTLILESKSFQMTPGEGIDFCQAVIGTAFSNFATLDKKWKRRIEIFSAPRLPEHAVSYQVKRIKFGINQLRNGTPSKLEELKKLAQQANLLARMGFWQVYAYVIVVVDAREQNAEEQNAGKVTFEGLSSEMRSKVHSAVSSATQLFDGRVGFGVIDLTQTMDSAPFTVGTHGLDICRFSKPAEQSEDLTNWVASIFKT